jgi:hypothetical protein
MADEVLKLAVSAGSLMNIKPTMLQKVRHLGAFVGFPDLRELEETYRIAERLGIGVEIPYRVHGSDVVKSTFEGGPRVLQIHAPIYASYGRIRAYGLDRSAALAAWLGNKATVGIGTSDFRKAVRLANHFHANIVLHPDIAEFLEAQGELEGVKDRIGYEADWPRKEQRESSYPVVWRVEDAIARTDYLKVRANPDSSHHLIGYNPDPEQVGDSLCYMVSEYGRRIMGFHVSGVATNPENPMEVYRGGSSLALNSSRLRGERGDLIRQGFKQFFDHAKEIVQREVKHAVPFVIEIYVWDDNANREEGIEATMNAFFTTERSSGSKSMPNKPTRRINP